MQDRHPAVTIGFEFHIANLPILLDHKPAFGDPGRVMRAFRDDKVSSGNYAIVQRFNC